MHLKSSQSLFKPGLCFFLIFILSSCGIPVKKNRYQQEPIEAKTSIGAVTELQQKAVQALKVHKAQLSIDYLERAIKIEPRNAMSWHYLAQSYYLQNNFNKCLAMLDRSMSYGHISDSFNEASKELKHKCQVEVNG
ncbi:MAG: tetratricopeptide repeat protein [Gammaproteobacteria bacterium]|nr:tetratricopeptide repeat protein [Gammaproteobacteria bacterium]